MKPDNQSLETVEAMDKILTDKKNTKHPSLLLRAVFLFAIAAIVFAPTSTTLWDDTKTLSDYGFLPSGIGQDFGYASLQEKDITDWSKFLNNFQADLADSDPTMAKDILKSFPPKLSDKLKKRKEGSSPDDEFKKDFVEQVNITILSPTLSQNKIREKAKISPEASALLKSKGKSALSEEDNMRLNRLLLEANYVEIAKSKTYSIKKYLNLVSTAEIFIAIGCLFAVIFIIVNGSWGIIRFLPASLLIFIIWMVVSISFHQATSPGKGLSSLMPSFVELLQTCLYLIGGVLLFSTAFKNAKRKNLILFFLWLTVAGVVAYAWRQSYQMLSLNAYWGPSSQFPMDISVFFKTLVPKKHAYTPNIGAYGMFLCITIPILYGLAISGGKFFTKVFCIILTIAAIGTITAPGPFIALILGLLLVSVLRRSWLAYFFLTIVLVGSFSLVHYLPKWQLPSKTVIEDQKVVAFIPGTRPLNRFELLNDRFQPFITFEEQKVRGLDETRPGNSLKHRYNEWCAGMNFLSKKKKNDWHRNFYFGSAPGNFQEAVNNGYTGFSTSSADLNMNTLSIYKKANVSEYIPGTNNQWIVLAVTLGVPGLLLFIVFLLDMFAASVRIGGRKIDPLRKGILYGCAGAIVAVMVAGIFTEIMVRGIGPFLALLIALVVATAKKIYYPEDQGLLPTDVPTNGENLQTENIVQDDTEIKGYVPQNPEREELEMPLETREEPVEVTERPMEEQVEYKKPDAGEPARFKSKETPFVSEEQSDISEDELEIETTEEEIEIDDDSDEFDVGSAVESALNKEDDSDEIILVENTEDEMIIEEEGDVIELDDDDDSDDSKSDEKLF